MFVLTWLLVGFLSSFITRFCIIVFDVAPYKASELQEVYDKYCEVSPFGVFGFIASTLGGWITACATIFLSLITITVLFGVLARDEYGKRKVLFNLCFWKKK